MADNSELMTDLKPCPFCGWTAVLRKSLEEYPADGEHPAGDFEVWTHIDCDMCGIELGSKYREDAIAAWNRRTPVTAKADARDSTVGAAVNTCAVCGERKATPLRIDSLGGYVCLSCALASARADALEEAAKAAKLERRNRDGNDAAFEQGACAASYNIEDAIRALINKDAGGK